MIVLSYFSRPSTPARLNHRRYASSFGYSHRVIDASVSHDNYALKVLHKYETLLANLQSMQEDDLLILLTECSAIVTAIPLERLMMDRARLLVHAPHLHEPLTDVQIWRNTQENRALLLSKALACHLDHKPAPEESELMSDCSDVDYFHSIDGIRPIFPAGANFAPLWMQDPTFAIAIGDAPPGDRHSLFPRLVWRSSRFNDVLIDYINRYMQFGVPELQCLSKQIDADVPVSLYNRNSAIAFVMLSTPEPHVRDYARLCERNFRCYCDHNGYALYVYRDKPNDAGFDASGNWYKPIVLRRALDAHDWVIWVDADTLVVDLHRRIEPLLEGRDRLFARDIGKWPLNAGIMAFRNTDDNRAILDALSAQFTAIDDKTSVYASQGDQFFFCEALRDRNMLTDNDIVSFVLINTPWQLRQPDSFIVHYYGMWPRMRTIMMTYDEAELIG
jgi:hypothetical protein